MGGASSESLTCNAVEWQVSEGGGPIIENNMVTVNNPETARAWEGAVRWLRTISPPGVIAYKERDAYNVRKAGGAAFMRNRPLCIFGELAQGSLTKDQFDIASLQRGRARVGATVGGRGYAFPAFAPSSRGIDAGSVLSIPDTQLKRSRKIGGSPTIPELYNDPRMLPANPYFSTILKTYRNGKILRPSTETGKRYPDLSRAYFTAVHEILASKKPAATSHQKSTRIDLGSIRELEG